MNYQAVLEKYNQIQKEEEDQLRRRDEKVEEIKQGANVMAGLYQEKAEAAKAKQAKIRNEEIKSLVETQNELVDKFNKRTGLGRAIHRKKVDEREKELKSEIDEKAKRMYGYTDGINHAYGVSKQYERLYPEVSIADFENESTQKLSLPEEELLRFRVALNEYERFSFLEYGGDKATALLQRIKGDMEALLNRTNVDGKEIVDAVIEEINNIKHRAAEHAEQQKKIKADKDAALREIRGL
jgi:hypothetical protein